MDKVIFLDIDGVLNHTEFLLRMDRLRKSGDLPSPTISGEHAIDPACVALINEICARSGADIVVSSSWRLFYGLADLRGVLRHHGLTAGRVIGATPNVGYPRGQEIAAWLHMHGRRPLVILDDYDDMCELTPWLVRTDHEVGLQPEYVEQALVILAREATW